MAPKPPRRIAVTGGGTAGHILAALDFLHAYQHHAATSAVEGFFIGCSGGMECDLVPAHAVRLETIPGKPWARQGWAGRLLAIAAIPPGILAARRILRREHARLVIGTGGYASFGTAIAAWTLGIPVVIHESNVEPGLANRILAKFADLVAVGFEETRHAFGPHTPKVVVTGIPAHAVPRTPPEIPAFIVLGGSEGSPILNAEAPRLFRELHRRGVAFTVRHLTGFSNPAPVRDAYAEAGLDARVEGFVPDMRPIYAAATFAIAAAGARTLAELAACGIPALVVPNPGLAANHQSRNATRFTQQTAGALTVPPGPWDAEALASRIQAALRTAHETPQHPPPPDAASALVRECERMLQSRKPLS